MPEASGPTGQPCGWADHKDDWIYAYNMTEPLIASEPVEQVEPMEETPRLEALWGRLEIDQLALGHEGGDVTVKVYTQEPKPAGPRGCASQSLPVASG